MLRGEEKIFYWPLIAWAVHRSSDGLWAWNENEPVLPWFAYKMNPSKILSVKLGEYMYFLMWSGFTPFKILAFRLICWLSRGKYVMRDRDTGERL
jgi:hypothetical protein